MSHSNQEEIEQSNVRYVTGGFPTNPLFAELRPFLYDFKSDEGMDIS